ncbi:MAG: sigma-54-dependent transcriptional regulator [Alphaproteobacteria bacterium]
MNEKILIIDDEEDIRVLIKDLLEDEGYKTFIAKNSNEAYHVIKSENPSLIIQDIWLQGSEHDGLQILKTVKNDLPYLPFIMISGHGTIETAVSAIKQGAYDFIEKPFNSDRLLLMVHRALERSTLKKENIILKKSRAGQLQESINHIPSNIMPALEKTSKTNSRVFLTGEAGTGKNISAQYLHENSSRKDHPFMVLNCANKTAEEIETELFGSIEQTNIHSSLLNLVDGGTLLLDEVLELPAQTQGKILMLLQENAYYPIGSNSKNHVDIRVISTSSKNPKEAIDEGRFRQDLYYRLNVVEIYLPPLRERKQDIEDILRSCNTLNFTKDALLKLKQYAWPGNVKQLNNLFEYLSIMKNNDDVIDFDDISSAIGDNNKKVVSVDNDNSLPHSHFIDATLEMGLRDAREHFERTYLMSQIDRFDGNISKTAEFVGMERSALHRKLKSLDVFSDDKQNVA